MTRVLGRCVRALAAVAAVLALTTPAASAAPSHERAAAAPGQVVRFDSWGPLKLGMTHHRAFRTGMVSRRLSGCSAGYQMTRPYRERGFVVWKGDFPRMSVKAIVVRGTGEVTASGARVGSTLRGLRAAYGTRLRLARGSALDGAPQRGPDLWVASVRGTGGTLNFHFAYGARPGPTATVDSVMVARRPAVYWGC